MKLPFISPLHWANGCLKDSPVVAHLILTRIAENWHVPILQMGRLKLKEDKYLLPNQMTPLLIPKPWFYHAVPPQE